MTEEWPTPALYQQALDEVKGNLRNCDDAALMATLLEANAQNLLGAVSPVLVWRGTQAKGMTTMELPATGRYYQFDVEGV
jgi:hypothetical protein